MTWLISENRSSEQFKGGKSRASVAKEISVGALKPDAKQRKRNTRDNAKIIDKT